MVDNEQDDVKVEEWRSSSRRCIFCIGGPLFARQLGKALFFEAWISSHDVCARVDWEHGVDELFRKASRTTIHNIVLLTLSLGIAQRTTTPSVSALAQNFIRVDPYSSWPCFRSSKVHAKKVTKAIDGCVMAAVNNHCCGLFSTCSGRISLVKPQLVSVLRAGL